MPSIFDIAPPEVLTETLEVTRGDTTLVLELRPISMLKLAKLIRRFPVLGRQMRGEDVDEGELFEQGVGMLPALIAASVSKPDEDEEGVEQAVRKNLSEPEQQLATAKIFRITNPAGVKRPFADEEGTGGSAPSIEGQDTSSPRQSTS